MKTPLPLALYCTRIFNTIFAQKNPTEYIVIDSSNLQGNVTLLSKGRVQFQVSNTSKPVVFDAHQLKDFCDAGKAYKSLLLDSCQKFIRRIVFSHLLPFRKCMEIRSRQSEPERAMIKLKKNRKSLMNEL